MRAEGGALRSQRGKGGGREQGVTKAAPGKLGELEHRCGEEPPLSLGKEATTQGPHTDLSVNA